MTRGSNPMVLTERQWAIAVALLLAAALVAGVLLGDVFETYHNASSL